MGFFDKKKSTKTYIDETNVNNVDNTQVEADTANIGGNVNLTFAGNVGGGSVHGGSSTAAPSYGIGGGGGGDGGAATGNAGQAVGDITITTTDFGAIDSAVEITEKAFDFSNEATNNALTTANGALQKAIEGAQTATQDEAARTQQFLILGGVVTVIAVSFFIYRKK